VRDIWTVELLSQSVVESDALINLPSSCISERRRADDIAFAVVRERANVNRSITGCCGGDDLAPTE